jgi:hypothetical protein
MTLAGVALLASGALSLAGSDEVAACKSLLIIFSKADIKKLN